MRKADQNKLIFTNDVQTIIIEQNSCADNNYYKGDKVNHRSTDKSECEKNKDRVGENGWEDDDTTVDSV